MKTSLLIGITLMGIIVVACEEEGENETKISTYSSSESHNTGKNCMDCHKSGEPGEGWFIVAGTVYDTSLSTIYPNATVKLTSEPNGSGTIMTQIAVDKNGNFYTTESVSFGQGLYVAVMGEGGTVKYMGSKITSGQCNSCHGVSTDKIWAE